LGGRAESGCDADAGNNIARSSEANFRDVKLVPARLWNF
jgi:hypothetical protein